MIAVKNNADSTKLLEKKPAIFWEEAFPLGNGTLGAMVFGDPDNERLALNEETLWSGYPQETYNGDGFKSLKKAKEHIKNGDYVAAHKEISDNFGGYTSQTYLPLCDLIIENFGNKSKIKGYKRTLDLSRSICAADYIRNDIVYHAETFVSHPDKVIVHKIEATDKTTAPAKEISVYVKLQSQLYSKTFVENSCVCLEGECPVTSRQNIDNTDRKQLYFNQPEKRGIRFSVRAEILTDGDVWNFLNFLEVKNATYLEIRLTAATSFNGFNKHPFTNGKDYIEICKKMQNDLKDKDYTALKSAHIKDFSSYFKRVAIDLGSDKKSNVSTSQRLYCFGNGESDKALPALLFNFGRYLTIAGSRKGSQAMNLQGIWNHKFDPPWHSNYTVNINTEMNYFPTLAINLKEMYEPLLSLIKDLSNVGHKAAALYNAEGWCCHHNTDLWRFCTPVSGNAAYLFWSEGGGWLCRHLFEYYEYTLDKKFLKTFALPIIEGAAKFYLSRLETLDGYHIISPATSPENAFYTEEGEYAAISETTEMTMAIVRELFGNYISICEILNITTDVLPLVKKELPLLLPPRIGTDGKLLEWYKEMREFYPDHRHASLLYGLHPSNQITSENTPELAEACRKTLDYRGDDGTGWSLAWKACFYTRLKDGNRALKLLKRQLKLKLPSATANFHDGGTYPNMFCAHPPFQIDGNFGITSAITEMFLQSTTDELYLLPALPDEWSDCAFDGICAKGNRTASLKIKKGKLAYCKIKGTKPCKITVCGVDYTDKFIPHKDGYEYTAE